MALTMTAFLGSSVRQFPEKTYEETSEAWTIAGGKGKLNEKMFMKSHRSWHVGRDRQIAVGPPECAAPDIKH